MRPPEPPSEDNPLPRSHPNRQQEEYDELDVQETAGSQDFERTIFIQTHKVGYLIGHHGRTILGFENDTGAKIDILVPKSRVLETPIKVSGKEANVRHALRLIMDLYAFNNYSSEIWQNPQTSSTFLTADPTELIGTEEILVAPYFATFIIQNDTLGYIEAKSGSKVMICRESGDHPHTVPLAIIGNVGNNRTAVKLIQSYLDDFYENEALVKSWKRADPAVYADNPYKKFGVSKRYFWNKFESDGYKHDTTRGDHKPAEPQEVIFELTSLKQNFGSIILHPICKYNNVTMETFAVDVNLNKKIDKGTEEPCSGRKIVIRGQEANVKNAKQDLLRQIELAAIMN